MWRANGKCNDFHYCSITTAFAGTHSCLVAAPWRLFWLLVCTIHEASDLPVSLVPSPVHRRQVDFTHSCRQSSDRNEVGGCPGQQYTALARLRRTATLSSQELIWIVTSASTSALQHMLPALAQHWQWVSRLYHCIFYSGSAHRPQSGMVLGAVQRERLIPEKTHAGEVEGDTTYQPMN